LGFHSEEVKMGVWGPGVFENDEAIDWLHYLLQTDNVSSLLKVLNTINQNKYLEMPDCVRALIASEIIVAKLSGDYSTLPNAIRSWVENLSEVEIRKLVGLAKDAVKRISTNSELKELWDNTEDSSGWYRVVSNLEGRLEG
jgi:hypothetical protein